MPLNEKPKPTALERARMYQRKKTRLVISDDEVELAVAFLRGEVSLAAIASALGHKTSTNLYTHLLYGLVRAHERGLITTKPTEPK